MSVSSSTKSNDPGSDQPDLEEVISESRARALAVGNLYTFSWWLVVLLIVGFLIFIAIAVDPIYAGIFDQLKEGISMTIGVSFGSYFVALMIALVIGIIRSSPPEPPQTKEGIFDTFKRIIRTIIYNIATIYISVMRGLPILIVLLVTAFIIVPAVRDDLINAIIVPFLRQVFNNPDISNMEWRGSSAPSAIMALAAVYAAYMSETIRAGIQSISKGQVEAAYSLGMTYAQTMRYIVLPQAFRNVLPPLGNDLIAMIKDSSLLAFLGVRDITQVAKTSSGRSFRYIETYSIVAVLYLTMTILGSIVVRAIEDTLGQDKDTPRWVTELGQMWRTVLGTSRKRKLEERVSDQSFGFALGLFLFVLLLIHAFYLALFAVPDAGSLFFADLYGDTGGTVMIVALVAIIIGVVGLLTWRRLAYALIAVAYMVKIALALWSLNFGLILTSFIGFALFIHLMRHKLDWLN